MSEWLDRPHPILTTVGAICAWLNWLHFHGIPWLGIAIFVTIGAPIELYRALRHLD